MTDERSSLVVDVRRCNLNAQSDDKARPRSLAQNSEESKGHKHNRYGYQNDPNQVCNHLSDDKANNLRVMVLQNSQKYVPEDFEGGVVIDGL